jgi:carbon starvation protein CstA
VSVLVIMVIAAVVLILGGRFYAPVIARVLGERPDRPTPACTINDGRDYVPTRTPVVFAHHYASIAGAGPIIGPILAIYYGWGPALLWIVLGGVFLGAVHDYVATHIAVREGGKNLAIVARRYIGGGAFVMMLIMLVALLVLVCAAFLDLSATALTSKVGVADLQLPKDQTVLRVVDDAYFSMAVAPAVREITDADLLARLREQFDLRGRTLSEAPTISVTAAGAQWQVIDGDLRYRVDREGNTLTVYEEKGVIGGIASTSVIVITMFSPLLGFLYLKRKTPVWVCSLLAIGICALSIWIGLRYPVDFRGLAQAVPLGWNSQQWWKFFISAYVLVSAGLPVWLFLQSRDFINVHILYVGMACLVVALFAAAIRGGGVADGAAIPINNWSQASAKMGPGWPVLFITIACGAVSGFHSLCAGGTTCKQLRTEQATRHVGYFAMLLESFLAVCVVCCLIVGLSLASYKFHCYPSVGKGNAVLAFAMAVGHTAHVGLGLPVAIGALAGMLLLEGFLVTTLDTAIRLTRYMIEEAWAIFFGRYDIFADAVARQQEEVATAAGERGAVELTGTGGLTLERPDLREAMPAGTVATHGVGRALLRFLRHYWVNSGVAVILMLLLGWGNGYKVLWQIFGSANQLLAALTLVVATCWLISKRRPLWYTLLPAVFMLVTSVWMLIRLLATEYLPNWQDQAPLAITAVIVLLMTTGIVASAIRRWVRREVPATAVGG